MDPSWTQVFNRVIREVRLKRAIGTCNRLLTEKETFRQPKFTWVDDSHRAPALLALQQYGRAPLPVVIP